MYKDINHLESELDSISKSNSDLALGKLQKILLLLPKEYQSLIEQAFCYKRIPKEYTMSAIFFTMCTASGLTFYMEAFGYKNYSNLYFIVIGSRGDFKSEAIKTATAPLKEMDKDDYAVYKQEILNADNSSGTKIPRKQMLVHDATIEAAQKIHDENPNSIGILIDEIYGMVERMGNSRSRDGLAWRNFFLEGYTNAFIDVGRKTTESFRLNDTCPTLLGGLQNQFTTQLFSNGNLESGFLDRILFTAKLTSNMKMVRGGIPVAVIDDYCQSVKHVLSYKRQSEDTNEKIKQFKIQLTDEAENALFDYLQDLINRQSNAPAIIKEYMAKMQISIHKLCILVFLLKHSKKSSFASSLGRSDVELAVELNEFYLLNFKILLEQKDETNTKEVTVEQIIDYAKKKGASQKTVVELTGLHKGTISKKWHK
ncbi:DUF3987 domain-containing protein [Gelidibacter japonicus]|uniref:DUF3987 domain-containing protein n=1 Tax=Gelidibacter japonicus TaxID=1962232 RepID=UPI003A948DB6